jgi:hypothetical protein
MIKRLASLTMFKRTELDRTRLFLPSRFSTAKAPNRQQGGNHKACP